VIRWTLWGVGTRPPDRAGLRVLARLCSARPRGVPLAAIGVAAVAAELLALRPVVFERETPVQAIEVVLTLVGGSFAACGLVAWRRRPDSRSGMLMTATGFLFLFPRLLSQLDAELAGTVMVLATDWWIFCFAALILTLHKGGRLDSRLDRALVAAYALPLVIGQVAWMMFDPQVGQLLLAFPDADVAYTIDRIQRGTMAGAAIATVAAVLVSWWQSSGPRRRALLPSVAGAFALSCNAALLINDLIAGTRSQTLLWLTACSFVTVPLAFLAGLLRSRLARGGLTDLILRLGSTRGAELEAALRRALGDPSLVLAFEGAPVGGGGRAVAPIENGGRQVAAIVYDASLDDDPELVEAVTSAAAIALENERLQAESAQQLEELRASRERIVAAGDAERRRLERNLHDGAQQRLVAIALQLRLLQNRIAHDPAAAELLTSASDELSESLSELRELARGMHPAVLEHGLPAALDALASRSTVATSVAVQTRERLPDAIELTAYFVASEALANIAKYAHATHASIRLKRNTDQITIEIADNGIGGANPSDGSGLRGLTDRVEALDGQLHIQSPPGTGTTITAHLPCAS
jgi:signal transduction histidine kinase